MAYSTNDDLFERMDEKMVIKLTDDASTGMIDQDVLDAKRSTCYETVNTFLRGHYDVPMDPAPDILADVEADLLVEKLYARRPNIETPESVKRSLDQAMIILKDISRGNLQLEQQKNIQAGQFKTNKTAEDRKFSESRLKHF